MPRVRDSTGSSFRNEAGQDVQSASSGKQHLHRELPPTRQLEQTLTSALAEFEPSLVPKRFERLGVHLFASSHPSETVVCVGRDGSRLRLFCKYARDYRPPLHRHRGGVSYEARVYRNCVEPFDGTSARFYGGDRSSGTNWAFLFLEELQGVLRVSKTAPDNMARTAAWIGRFHAGHDTAKRAEFLNAYGLDYYIQWADRAHALTRPLHAEQPWIPVVMAAFKEKIVCHLLGAPRTVVHGELYPKNVMARGRDVYPVDWESAGVAPGEIDLASLTEGWKLETTRQCVEAYVTSRWPSGPPHDFEKALMAARFYWLLRWLGNSAYFVSSRHGPWRIKALHSLARRTGLLPGP